MPISITNGRIILINGQVILDCCECDGCCAECLEEYNVGAINAPNFVSMLNMPRENIGRCGSNMSPCCGATTYVFSSPVNCTFSHLSPSATQVLITPLNSSAPGSLAYTVECDGDPCCGGTIMFNQ